MNREEALLVWAPPESPWSPWTKAVLFAFLPEEISDDAPPAGPSCRVPRKGGTALMIDLAGAEGVEFGVALAQSGYRPIPLYNACPYPYPMNLTEVTATPTRVPYTVDVALIISAIKNQTAALRRNDLPPSAPPAFLLDANRHGSWQNLDVGWYDNRSIVRESDLPTAAFLKTQGVWEVVLIQSKPDLARDLRTVLRAWQEGGVGLARQIAGEAWNPQGFVVPRPSWLRTAWDRLVLWLSCQPNAEGEFGRFTSG